MPLKARFLNSYRSAKTGKTVFRYEVMGTPAELEAYRAAKGENNRDNEDNGNPLFFSTEYTGEVIDLGISRKGNAFVDTTEMDKAASLAAKYGGNLGQEIAKGLAQSIVSRIKSTAVAPVAKTTEASAETETQPEGEDLGGLK